jgi:hypothetical protein
MKREQDKFDNEQVQVHKNVETRNGRAKRFQAVSSVINALDCVLILVISFEAMLFFQSICHFEEDEA